MPTMNKVDLLDCAAGHHHFDDAGECSVCGHQDEPDACDHLIGAAPEMLAALRAAEKVMGKYVYPKPDVGPEHPWSVLQTVRAAIARAEGREG